MMVSGVCALNHVKLLEDPLVMWNQHFVGQSIWYPRRIFCYFFMNICTNDTYQETTGYLAWAYWNVTFGSILNQFQWIGAMLVNIMSLPFVVTVSMIDSMPIAGYVTIASIAGMIFLTRKELALEK
jgi:hypothetical protein